MAFRSEGKSDYSDWMAKLPEHLRDKPLNELAIPGSHNSFSFCLDNKSDVGPDEPGFLRDALNFLGPLGKQVAMAWGRTQDMNFTQQLHAGVRYLDCRVATRHGKEGIFFLHCLYACDVQSALREIDSFLQGHPSEVVILDFNHFYHMSESDHKQFMAMIEDTLGSKMCPFLGLQSTTLNLMRENNLQVVVIYHNDLVLENLQFWPGSTIHSYWVKTCDISKLIANAENAYKQEKPGNIFHVLQGILCPDASCIISNLGGNLKNSLAQPATKAFASWLSGKKAGKGGVNICIVDHVEIEDFIPKVVALNYH